MKTKPTAVDHPQVDDKQRLSIPSIPDTDTELKWAGSKLEPCSIPPESSPRVTLM